MSYSHVPVETKCPKCGGLLGVLGCVSVKVQCPYCEYEFYANGTDKDCISSNDKKVDESAISTREFDLLEEIGILKDENIALRKENKILKEDIKELVDRLVKLEQEGR